MKTLATYNYIGKAIKMWAVIAYIEKKYPLITNRYFIKNHKRLHARYNKTLKALDAMNAPQNIDKWAVMREGKRLANMIAR